MAVGYKKRNTGMIKHWNYLKYVLKHKYYCFLECWKLKIPWRGLVHDLSKFRPCEWFPYVEYFYGGEHKTIDEIKGRYSGDNRNYGWASYITELNRSKEAVKENFDFAWLAHQHKNSHHFQHWILRYDDSNRMALQMPIIYACEMVADWRAAGKAIHGKDDTLTWYNKNKKNMLLHPETRRYVERLIGYNNEN